MFTRLLLKSVHSKKFTVQWHDHVGWEVSEEEDSRVVVSVRYRDWHRVERAMKTFADKATSLMEKGWIECPLATGINVLSELPTVDLA